MKPLSLGVLIAALLSACGEGDSIADKQKVIDVTPDTAVIKETEDKVNAAIQGNKAALDQAIDSQGGAH